MKMIEKNEMMTPHGVSDLDLPIYLFHKGSATRAYDIMGAHPCSNDGIDGYIFRVWAPHAISVSVTGSFDGWSGSQRLKKITPGGIWEGFVGGISEYTPYKYLLETGDGRRLFKSDPYGYHAETRPGTASKTFDLEKYSWGDGKWTKKRKTYSPYSAPLNIYEVHPGSWKCYEDGNFFSYRKLAEELIPYVKDMGFTHIELLPIAEHPLDASWGYQVTGYYAPTSRYGTPQDFMCFVDECHKAGLGIILDWVPGHFPKDEAGLRQFDGEECYEYSDVFKSEHKTWGTLVFDWGRNEVKSFLISNAMFWLDKFHVDGLRVDAVASMLYLDYARKEGEWRPNKYGDRGNLEAIDFFKELNTALFREFPNALMIAEESTSWPMITKPVDAGGLGFNFKWNMGWMNDSLNYMHQDPIFRGACHHYMTFVLTYAFSENYVLPLSHDEVVHMKGSLINKMPGDYEEKFANLRAYIAYMIAHPGKKLLFMGNEIAQFSEWNCEGQLDWNLMDYPMHKAFSDFIRALNWQYKGNAAFWECDDDWNGFKWINADDTHRSVLSFRRFSKRGDELLVISNFSNINYEQYQISLDEKAGYKLLISSSDVAYGGKRGVKDKLVAKKTSKSDADYSIMVAIPALSTSIWVRTN